MFTKQRVPERDYGLLNGKQKMTRECTHEEDERAANLPRESHNQLCAPTAMGRPGSTQAR